MLKKENRLLSNYEFHITHRYGEKVSGKFFYLYFFFPPAKEKKSPTKVGFVVSKKLCKTAVDRNKMKRIFREVVRRNFGKIQPGFWIVIHPKRKSLEASYEEINTDFNKILQKVPFSKEL